MCSKEEWKRNFSEKLIKEFGKDTFKEEELTQEFWTDLKIKCSSFFENEEGIFLQDYFWSDGLRDWLLSEEKSIN